jgi:hypothetical protein
MSPAKQPTVDVHLDANEALAALQKALPGQGIPPPIRRQDIVSALILYTTPEQAAGMLAAFTRKYL